MIIGGPAFIILVKKGVGLMENIIEINNLTFKYDNKNALFEGLNVSIEKGKITTLLGKNSLCRYAYKNISKKLKL